jgi:glycosyltransferase involved in cell wall biosynthesis
LLHLAMPFGAMHGWGICSQHLAKSLSSLTPLIFLTDRFNLQNVNGTLDYMYMQRFTNTISEYVESPDYSPPSAVIQAMFNDSLLPWEPRLKGHFNLGYIFSEQTVYGQECIENARRNFDVIAAGSTWCEGVLRQQGLSNTRTIIQGVDRSVFNPSANRKDLFNDRFVVYSGGKFELRKGQDLVIRAFAELARRHHDVLLVASWFNPWVNYMDSMRLSRHIDYEPGQSFDATMDRLLSANGLGRDQVLLLPPAPHHEMGRVYKNCDVGIFPNRCEGGTNLVLMEFMACGKPAIASFSTGHKDVVSSRNSLLLEDLETIQITDGQGGLHSVWDDPNLDELIEKLEWAYQHPEKLADLGQRAGEDLKAHTWEASARRFYNQVARAL